MFPLKMAVLVCRLFQNKIPTKDKSVKRGVLHKSHDGFIFGCEVTKCFSHVF